MNPSSGVVIKSLNSVRRSSCVLVVRATELGVGLYGRLEDWSFQVVWVSGQATAIEE